MSGERQFHEPWQAQALALAIAMQDAGIITPAQWAEALGRERARPGLRDDGGDYYESVVATLEHVLETASLSSRAELGELSEAWGRAARATPHGRPIVLENDPLKGVS